MIRIENRDILYHELLVIDSDADKHTCEVIGIGNNGNLLFIREKEANVGNAYYLEREFFLIDNDEYLNCLGRAAKNIRLQKSIAKGTTDLEVSYGGRYFRVGSPIRYIIFHKECSVFTGDEIFAEEHDFGRIDKFEYEKTIRIKDCDAVRITHKDAENEAVFFQREFSPSGFETWLDTLHSSI